MKFGRFWGLQTAAELFSAVSRVCNRRREVIAVINDLYAAAFLQLYRVWKRQHKTIADSAPLLRGDISPSLTPLSPSPRG